MRVAWLSAMAGVERLSALTRADPLRRIVPFSVSIRYKTVDAGYVLVLSQVCLDPRSILIHQLSNPEVPVLDVGGGSFSYG